VPAVLKISGPESRVNAVASAETDVVDVSGKTRDVDLKLVKAFVADARVQFQTPPVVAVKITIEKIEGNP
jgi:hypothetical protein